MKPQATVVPIAESPEVLKLFLAIPRAEIDRDIAETPDNFDSIWPEIQAYHRLRPDAVHLAVHLAEFAGIVGDLDGDLRDAPGADRGQVDREDVGELRVRPVEGQNVT